MSVMVEAAGDFEHSFPPLLRSPNKAAILAHLQPPLASFSAPHSLPNSPLRPHTVAPSTVTNSLPPTPTRAHYSPPPPARFASSGQAPKVIQVPNRSTMMDPQALQEFDMQSEFFTLGSSAPLPYTNEVASGPRERTFQPLPTPSIPIPIPTPSSPIPLSTSARPPSPSKPVAPPTEEKEPQHQRMTMNDAIEGGIGEEWRVECPPGFELAAPSTESVSERPLRSLPGLGSPGRFGSLAVKTLPAPSVLLSNINAGNRPMLTPGQSAPVEVNVPVSSTPLAQLSPIVDTPMDFHV